MMLCYKCETPARGICRLCGRALCAAHIAKNDVAYIAATYVDMGNVKAIVIDGVLWCGQCIPQPFPQVIGVIRGG